MSLGPTSRRRLAECHPDLQRLVQAVAEGVDAGELAPAVTDVTVLCGFRGQKDQNAAFAAGTSKLRWPSSKHNRTPAEAVDLAPYPVDWQNLAAFSALRGYVLGVARGLGIPLRVIEWDRPHYELTTRPGDTP